jgi:hypothetical protein
MSGSGREIRPRHPIFVGGKNERLWNYPERVEKWIQYILAKLFPMKLLK